MSREERPIATKNDWKITEMPERNTTFILSRKFSAEEIAALQFGNIPKAMEDKWFWFMEGDTLYAHRSWTGICVFRIDFSFADNQHKVTVNQDPEQVGITSEEEERRTLNNLLNWWTKINYVSPVLSEGRSSMRICGILRRWDMGSDCCSCAF